MFDPNRTDAERRDKLEDLIREENDDESDEENETPDDEQLNEMISRSPEELKAFNEMDQKRYEEEGKDARIKEIMEKSKGILPKHINYRLMQDFEVPY